MNRNDILREFPLAVELIQAEEGFRATPYRCSENKLTIGYGYNVTAHGHTEAEAVSWVWTREQAQAALLDELLDVVAALDARYPRWRELLNADREAVVISAVYQMGIGGAAKFVNTISKIRAKDWDGAAAGIMASRWARQTPERAQRNAETMRTGRLPEVVNGVNLLQAIEAQTVVAAPAQPAAPVLPAQGLPDAPGDGTTMGDAVRAVALPDRARLIPTLAGLAKSKTAWGIVGMFGMQLLGLVPWDVAIRVGQQIYTVPDLLPAFSSLFASLGIWGRITAKPLGGHS